MVFTNSREARSSRISDKMENSSVAAYVLEEMWSVDASFQLPLRTGLVASPDLEVDFTTI